MYITLDEFVSFGGRDFDYISEFLRLCDKASSYIDYYTQNRCRNLDDVPCGVKRAMFELCELIMQGDDDILSYSSDGVSVKKSENATFANRVYEIIVRNVPGELLYLGVDDSEK